MGELNRRNFVAGLGATLGGMAAAQGRATGKQNTASGKTARTDGPPNIIIIICDDLGYGDLGCYGSAIQTANIDRLAREGVRFTHYNTPHPLCSAARASLLTGRYSTRTGTRPVYFPQSSDGLNLDEQTIANVLQEKQYRSMCIGKWHLGSLPEYLPTSRGFDRYFGVPYSVDMRPLPMIRDKEVIEADTDRSLLTPRYTEEAVRFIESSKQHPFFLYLAYSYPHIPIDASPRFKGKSKKGIYGDAVEEIDWSVGRILETVEQNHLDENTLVIFTGDHGPWYQGSPGPLRGRKGTTYEGGCRVPFIARWKGAIPAGRVAGGWASHLDIMPTVASLCGAKLPSKPVDGVSITDLLTGKRESAEQNVMLYFAALKNDLNLQCIREEGWKLRISQFTVDTYVLGSNPGECLMLAKPELYNVGDDPGESYDVAANYPDIVKRLQQRIEQAIPTFPEKVIEAYRELQRHGDSATTPEGAAARRPSYVAAPYHFDGRPN